MATRIMSVKQQVEDSFSDFYRIITNKMPVVSGKVDCPKENCLIDIEQCLRCKYNTQYDEGNRYSYVLCSYIPDKVEEKKVNDTIIQLSKKYKKAMYKYNKNNLNNNHDVEENELLHSKVRRTSFGDYNPKKTFVRKISTLDKFLEHSEFMRQSLLDDKISKLKNKEIKRKEEWEKEAQKIRLIEDYYKDISSIYRNKVRRIATEDPKRISLRKYDISSSDKLLDEDRKFKEERTAKIKREACPKESVNDVSINELCAQTLNERFLNSDTINNLLNMIKKSHE